MIDGASQLSLTIDAYCKSLNVPFQESRNKTKTILVVVNNVAAIAAIRVEFNFSPYCSQNTFSVNALIVKKCTCNLSSFSVLESDWPHLKQIQFPEPSFHISLPMDII